MIECSKLNYTQEPSLFPLSWQIGQVCFGFFNHKFMSQKMLVKAFALSIISWLTLDKSFNFTELPFQGCKIGWKIVGIIKSTFLKGCKSTANELMHVELLYKPVKAVEMAEQWLSCFYRSLLPFKTAFIFIMSFYPHNRSTREIEQELLSMFYHLLMETNEVHRSWESGLRLHSVSGCIIPEPNPGPTESYSEALPCKKNNQQPQFGIYKLCGRNYSCSVSKPPYNMSPKLNNHDISIMKVGSHPWS